MKQHTQDQAIALARANKPYMSSHGLHETANCPGGADCPYHCPRPHARRPGASVRPVEQWQEILRTLEPQEAAIRIFGDLSCFRGDVRKGFSYEKREGYFDDVEQLARALAAFAANSTEG